MEQNETESDTTDATENMTPAPQAPQLTAIQLRVVGALMEKQLTTPDAYPLTLNSIATASNQKSSRDPISHYQQGELKRALQELEDNHFVRREYGSRAEKYSQQFIKTLELGKKQQALLCVMMLRGPQTVSELDTRTQRMCDFTDREDLEHCLERLCDRQTPCAVRLGQQPGQRGERFGHLFMGTPTVAPARLSEPSNATEPPSTQVEQNEAVALLEMEIAELRATVSALQAESSENKQRIDALYLLTGN